jgi:hypothetical protein
VTSPQGLSWHRSSTRPRPILGEHRRQGGRAAEGAEVKNGRKPTSLVAEVFLPVVRVGGSERMKGEALSGTAREEAVGSPPTREGTMSTTLLDAPAHLLNLPPQPLGPQVATGPRTASRRLTIHTPRGRGVFPSGLRRGPISRLDL